MAKQYKVFGNPKRNVPELNRVWFEVLHMTRDVSATDVVKRMSKKKSERIAPSTLRNLRNGKTIYPTLRTAFLVARAFGKHMSFSDEVVSLEKVPVTITPWKPIKLKLVGETAKNTKEVRKVA